MNLAKRGPPYDNANFVDDNELLSIFFTTISPGNCKKPL